MRLSGSSVPSSRQWRLGRPRGAGGQVQTAGLARVVGKPGRQQGPRPRSRGRRGPFPQSPHRAPFLHLGAPFCLLTLS